MTKKSIIYLAVNTESIIKVALEESSRIICKIGETEHSDVRASQLKKKGERIDKYIEVRNDKALRRYIESCLRYYIDSMEEAELFGNDHFNTSLATYNRIRSQFTDLVNKAIKQAEELQGRT